MFYFPAAFEMLNGVCSSAREIGKFQRLGITNNKTVGLEHMDAPNLLPVLNNYIFAHEAIINNQSNIDESIDLPWTQEGEWDFKDAGIFIKSTKFYYAIVGGKKGGVIRVWDKSKKRLCFQSCGYFYSFRSKKLSNQAQGYSLYSRTGNGVEIKAPFIKINQKNIFAHFIFMF